MLICCLDGMCLVGIDGWVLVGSVSVLSSRFSVVVRG